MNQWNVIVIGSISLRYRGLICLKAGMVFVSNWSRSILNCVMGYNFNLCSWIRISCLKKRTLIGSHGRICLPLGAIRLARMTPIHHQMDRPMNSSVWHELYIGDWLVRPINLGHTFGLSGRTVRKGSVWPSLPIWFAQMSFRQPQSSP